jgi:hypothetical protein
MSPVGGGPSLSCNKNRRVPHVRTGVRGIIKPVSALSAWQVDLRNCDRQPRSPNRFERSFLSGLSNQEEYNNPSNWEGVWDKMSPIFANSAEMITHGAPRVIHNDAELEMYTETLFRLTALKKCRLKGRLACHHPYWVYPRQDCFARTSQASR